VMYLINAIYFKGDWTHQFSEKKTRDGSFFLAGGAKKSVPMMHMEEELRYARANRCTALRLPYGQEKLAMYILLPDRGTDLDAIISEMDEESWRWLRSELEEEDIALAMPRYELEYEKTLNGVLASMGMGIAFGAEADFSGIHPGFSISEVIHKAVIEVNEEGSEAAAVTAAVLDQSAPPERIEFIVDRPFFFAIADDRTGCILFMGKVTEP
jgi:serine protease inhibitor